MNSLIVQFAVVAIWVAPLFAMVALAGAFRNRLHGGNKKNPLTSGLLRGPGHTLRARLEDLRYEMLAYVSIGGSMPLLVVTMYLALKLYADRPVSAAWIYAVIASGAFAFCAFKVVRGLRAARNLNLGMEAESAVGEELNLLMKNGYAVFHDIEGDKAFNVDHVLVGPAGVFAVETKGRAKLSDSKNGRGHIVELIDGKLRFPNGATSEPIEQAQRNAKWLRSWLSSAVGEPVAVQPVIVLPGWYIDLKSRPEFPILNDTQCGRHFARLSGNVLSPKLIQQISHQLDARCRDVEPTTYKPVAA